MSIITDPGEYIAGCYLQKVLECDFVNYNVRPPGGGRGSQAELDVIGLRLRDKHVFLCEVAIHLRGFNYGSGIQSDIAKVRQKHEVQRQYAANYLGEFTPEYMFWSPVVPKGKIISALAEINGLSLVINGAFQKCVEQLRSMAAAETHDSGNEVFRYLQIMERLG